MEKQLNEICEKNTDFQASRICNNQFRIHKGDTKILDIWNGRYSFRYFEKNQQYYFCFIHWRQQLELLLNEIRQGNINIESIFKIVPFKVPSKSGFWSYDEEHLMIGYSASFYDVQKYREEYYKQLKQNDMNTEV